MEGATSAQPDGGGSDLRPAQRWRKQYAQPSDGGIPQKSNCRESAPPFSLIVERVSPRSPMVETAPSPTKLTEEPCQVEDG